MTDVLAHARPQALSPGALRGLKVIDLSRVLGGPSAGQMLGDHGADVIKVEPPQGDETREWGPPFREIPGEGRMSAYYMGLNRNKRGLALDLSKPRGQEALHRLLEGADILLENFKPGAMARWGLDYERDLKDRFPRLIHCSVTGFGPDGPLGGLPGYDAIAQAFTGLISINGSEASGPMRLGLPVVDLATGLNAMIGILLALYERERSGRGQHVDVTLYDTGVALQHPHAANWFASGELPGLTGNAHPNVAPYSLYETGTRPLFLGVGNDGQFRRFCDVLGVASLADDPRFRTNADRSRNRDALSAEIARLMADKDGEALAATLLAKGVPAGPAQTVGEALGHAHTRHRAMVIEDGPYQGTGVPVKLSRSPGGYHRPPPAFAADARAILAEAGFTSEEIADLVREGIVPEARRDG